MAETISPTEIDRLIASYLERLANDLGALPVGRREALLSEIRDHIDALRAEVTLHDAADLQALLARVGSTEEIASAALEDGEPSNGPSTRRPRSFFVLLACLMVLVVLGLGAGLLAGFTSFFGGGAPTPANTQLISPRVAATVRIPNVVGTNQAQACAYLAAVNLVCKIQTAQNAQVPAGDVFVEQPTPGSRTPPDSLITILVSQGPPHP